MTHEPRLPNHIAMIMDGNRRWAKLCGVPMLEGYQRGAQALQQLFPYLKQLGIKFLTIFVFSCENFKRSPENIKVIMKLIRYYLDSERANFLKENIGLKILGDLSPFDEDLQESLRFLEHETRNYAALNLQIALNYSGRQDILACFKKILPQLISGSLSLDMLQEKSFSEFLQTGGIPDPDLVIRTSGEQRLSNFLLWQAAYSEFYFTPVLWPDFDCHELDKALKHYSLRERRYGV